MLAIIGKILALIPLILTSGLGMLQAVIKFAKEVVTLVINLFFPFTPDNGKFEAFVVKVRGAINTFSDWFDKAKVWLTKIAGVN